MSRSRGIQLVREIDSLIEQAADWETKSRSGGFWGSSSYGDTQTIDPKAARRALEATIHRIVGLVAACLDHFEDSGADVSRIRENVIEVLGQDMAPGDTIAFLRLLSGRLRGLALTMD